jgi:hypothetical protein
LVQPVLATLVQAILPLSVPVLSGVLLARFLGLDTKPLTTMVLYFLVPALIFTNLSTVQLSFTELTHIVLFFLLNFMFMWAIAFIVGKIFRLPEPERAGLTLISTLTNSVNYGLPLVLMAFGQLGLEKAAVYVVFAMILTNTAGVYFAARANFSIRESIKTIFTLPAVYAAILAILLRFLGLHLPAGIETGVSMAAGALPPVMLVVLGAQMARAQNAKLENRHRIAFWLGIGIRVIIAPFIAFLILYVIGISGTLFSVLLILASMPVAVNAGVLAEKFDASPNVVSKCILWTTLSSFVVLPILITLVK